MRSFMYTIKVPVGMHARHAGLLVREAQKYQSDVRFTVGDCTTKEDIDYAVDALAKVVNTLRQVSPVTGKEGW